MFVLYLLEIVEVRLSLDTIYFQGCHWSIEFTDIQRERKRVDYELKLKVPKHGYSDQAVGIKRYPF